MAVRPQGRQIWRDPCYVALASLCHLDIGGSQSANRTISAAIGTLVSSPTDRNLHAAQRVRRPGGFRTSGSVPGRGAVLVSCVLCTVRAMNLL